MPAKSRFTRLDAFTKTVEDARIRTTSGGVVTIVSLLVVFYLVLAEWADYTRIEVHPEIVVDKGRGMDRKVLRIIEVLLIRNSLWCRREDGDSPEYDLSSSAMRVIDP